MNDKYLACLSDTGTVHIFNLQNNNNTFSKFSFAKNLFSYFGS